MQGDCRTRSCTIFGCCPHSLRLTNSRRSTSLLCVPRSMNLHPIQTLCS